MNKAKDSRDYRAHESQAPEQAQDPVEFKSPASKAEEHCKALDFERVAYHSNGITKV